MILLYGASNLINPAQVIIDHSQVLLISFLQVYCMESIEDYLHKAFRIASGSGKPKDVSKILPHACTSHVMNSVTPQNGAFHYATNINVTGFFPFRFQNEQYRFSMYCFSILVNCSTLDEFISLFKLLYCSK